MASTVERLIRSMFDCNAVATHYKSVIAASGCGSSAISSILSVPGASSLVLEATVPYLQASFQEYLDTNGRIGYPAKYASVEAAVALAEASRLKSQLLLFKQTPSINELVSLPTAKLGSWQHLTDHVVTLQVVNRALGVGIAGALHTNRARHGADVAYVAAINEKEIALGGMRFAKEGASREAQEEQTRLLTLEVLRMLTIRDCNASCPEIPSEIVDTMSKPILESRSWDFADDTSALPEGLACLQIVSLPDPLASLLDGTAQPFHLLPVRHVLYIPLNADGSAVRCISNALIPDKAVVMSGSFNPYHAGHEGMANAALAQLQAAVKSTSGTSDCSHSSTGPSSLVYELSAFNVDKPPLSYDAVWSRVHQIVHPTEASSTLTGVSRHPAPVLVTQCARFVDKASSFPGADFVIGYDTARRLIEPKYYDGSADKMVEALLRLKLNGTRFIVAGRVDTPPGASAPAFLTLSDLAPTIPSLLSDMFVGIPESLYRMDLSSTDIRAKAAGLSKVATHG